MKLSRRINFILLPTITLVIGLVVILAILENERQEANFLERRLAYELQNIQDKLVEQAVLMASSLDRLLSNEVMAGMRSRSTTPWTDLARHELILQHRARLRVLLPNLGVLQFYDHQGNLLLSADDRDLFATPQPTPVPPGVRWWGDDKADWSSMRAYYLTGSDAGSTALVLVKRFVPELLSSHSQLRTRENNYLYALLTAELTGQQGMVPGVLAPGVLAPGVLAPGVLAPAEKEFRLHIEPRLPRATGQRDQKQSIIDLLTGPLSVNAGTVSSQTPLYHATLTTPDNYAHFLARPLNWSIAALGLLLMVMTYVSLRGLIHRQVIKPLMTLASQVQGIRADTSTQLALRSGDDEITQLNNAYVDLVKDVQHLASFDSLTGLANRRHFQFMLEKYLPQCLAQGKVLALLYIDLDNFKRVNDTFGHGVGDRLLCEFTRRLQGLVRNEDVVVALEPDNQLARLAGDEFALLLHDIPGTAAAVNVARRLLSATENGIEVDGTIHDVHASIGIAMAPLDARDVPTLMRYADAAMYQAKLAGKGRYRIFSEEIARQIAEYDAIEKALVTTLNRDSFYLEYMPIYAAKSLQVTGAEVLLRCSHPLLRRLGPEKFIPVAESTGLIRQIDLWVIEHALDSLRELQNDDEYRGVLSINISASELHNEQFPQQVKALLDKYRIAPGSIELELTETTLVDSDQASVEMLRQLRQLGVSIALDDFGTGYTAFSQLNHYPLNTLKIDRSFVQAMANERDQHRPMVDVVLELSRIFNLETVAEGVESTEQLQRLRQLGCNYLQGYYLSKPLPLEAFRALLTRQDSPVSGLVATD